MSANQIGACVFLILAYAFLAAGIFITIFLPYNWKSQWRTRRGYFFILCLLVSVGMLNTSVVVGSGEAENFGQGFVSVISGTFQFFTLDAGYTELLENLDQVFPLTGFFTAFYVLTCFYVVFVPIVGGFTILQFLRDLSPRFALWRNCKRTKYVFSELNERSIALAEDIARLSWGLRLFRKRKNRTDLKAEGIDLHQKKWLRSACIIFTDAYTDEGSERSAELLARAKNIGAICLRDEVLERPLHFWFYKNRKLVYYLIDANEENNLVTALSLLSDKRDLWKRTVPPDKRIRHSKTDNMEMYVFSKSEDAPELIDRARNACSNGSDVLVKVINEYRNVVYKMIDINDIAESLISGEIKTGENNAEESYAQDLLWKNLNSLSSEDCDNRFVILGGGRIGKEYFKTVVWCCQQLASLRRKKFSQSSRYKCKQLKIVVLSDNASEFKRELAFEMPETVTKYYEAIFKDVSFGTDEFKDAFANSNAAQSQRILIAFGDDEMNLQAAQWVERELYAACSMRENSFPTVIDYAIENDDLYETLKQETEGVLKSKKHLWCYVRPFSTMKECFSFASIRMDNLEIRALQAERIHSNQTVNGFFSVYNHDSSVAASLYFPYKLLCLNPSDDPNQWRLDYFMKILGHNKIRNCKNQLYWLEHYRWCAYMLTKGYRCPTAQEFAIMAFEVHDKFIYFKNKGQKNNDLRLHACLIKSDAQCRSVEDVILNYAMRVLPHTKEPLIEEINAIRESRVKELTLEWEANKCRTARNVAFDRIRTILQSECNRIKTEIEKVKLQPQKIPLTAFLKELFGKDFDADPLDRLSMLVTLCMGNAEINDAPERYVDYKRHDIEMARDMYLHILRTRLNNYFQALYEREAKLPWRKLADVATDLRNAYGAKIKEENNGKRIDPPEIIPINYGESYDFVLLRSAITEDKDGVSANITKYREIEEKISTQRNLVLDIENNIRELKNRQAFTERAIDRLRPQLNLDKTHLTEDFKIAIRTKEKDVFTLKTSISQMQKKLRAETDRLTEYEKELSLINENLIRSSVKEGSSVIRIANGTETMYLVQVPHEGSVCIDLDDERGEYIHLFVRQNIIRKGYFKSKRNLSKKDLAV